VIQGEGREPICRVLLPQVEKGMPDSWPSERASGQEGKHVGCAEHTLIRGSVKGGQGGEDGTQYGDGAELL